jgi:hypothetical protein
MRPTFTRGATHNFQPPENWDAKTMDGKCGDLQVRAATFGEANVIELVSTWKPTEYELKMLNEGGVIEIGLCTAIQPAMRAYVVEPVERDLAKYLPQEGTVAEREALTTIDEEAHGHG